MDKKKIKGGDVIRKVFMDPNGHHVIIGMKSGQSFYLNLAKSTREKYKFHSLKKFEVSGAQQKQQNHLSAILEQTSHFWTCLFLVFFKKFSQF